MGLNEIAKIVHDPSFDRLTALEDHQSPAGREAQLKLLINNVKDNLKGEGQLL